jgi:hypothetical protein
MASSDSLDKKEEYLLEEYKKESEALAASEGVGDTRVSQFMTIASSLIGALGIANILVPALNNENLSAFTSSIPPESYFLAVAGLLVLLAFGFVTLVRLIHRNFVTDEHKIRRDRIRKYYAENYPDIVKYMPYDPTDPDEKPKNRREKWVSLWSLGTGGLVQTLALMNAIIFATMWFLVTIVVVKPIIGEKEWSFIVWIIALVVGGLAFLVLWWRQFLYIHNKYDKNYTKLKRLMDQLGNA